MSGLISECHSIHQYPGAIAVSIRHNNHITGLWLGLINAVCLQGWSHSHLHSFAFLPLARLSWFAFAQRHIFFIHVCCVVAWFHMSGCSAGTWSLLAPPLALKPGTCQLIQTSYLPSDQHSHWQIWSYVGKSSLPDNGPHGVRIHITHVQPKKEFVFEHTRISLC